MARSRKSVWLPDELILVLALYRREGCSARAESIRELSSLLRAIPIDLELAEAPSFRSSGSVAFKLANFRSIDPSDPAQGFDHGGARDREVWDEFSSHGKRLETVAGAIAEEIRLASTTGALPPADSLTATAPEGQLLTRRHAFRERDPEATKLAERLALESSANLQCEACSFDFSAAYGQRGERFIEFHHTVPVGEIPPGAPTRAEDLALICSNCHRMLHRSSPWLTITELRELRSCNFPPAVQGAREVSRG